MIRPNRKRHILLPLKPINTQQNPLPVPKLSLLFIPLTSPFTPKLTTTRINTRINNPDIPQPPLPKNTTHDPARKP